MYISNRWKAFLLLYNVYSVWNRERLRAKKILWQSNKPKQLFIKNSHNWVQKIEHKTKCTFQEKLLPIRKQRLLLFLCIFPQLWKVESLGRKGWQWLGFYRPRLGSNGGGYVYDLKRGRSRQFQSPRPPPWCSPRRVALQSGLVSNFHSHYQSHFTLFGTELWAMANVKYRLLIRSLSYFELDQVEGSQSS